ncbi:MAG: alpha/beta hydrolase family protein [Myxococcota bacterium]
MRTYALLPPLFAVWVTACAPTSSPAPLPDDAGSPEDCVAPAVGVFEDGCAGSQRRRVEGGANERGPYDVGARTVTVGRLRTEVWYPAVPGSAACATPRVYDIRENLDANEALKVSDEQNPWQPCDCAEGLPLDAEGGPFPLVVFVHGTAAFRTQSLGLVTQLASRGFVVMAADHPGLRLADTLAPFCGYPGSGFRDLEADITALLEGAAAADGELAFLAGHVDTSRVGLVGHSAGGSAVAQAASLPGVTAVAPLAGNVAVNVPGVRSVFLAALEDKVVAPSQTKNAFENSTGARGYVALAGSGHLAFSDLCETKNTAGQNLLDIATEVELCGANLAGFLFDCDDSYAAQGVINAPFHAAVISTLEEALFCRDSDLTLTLEGLEAVSEVVVVNESQGVVRAGSAAVVPFDAGCQRRVPDQDEATSTFVDLRTLLVPPEGLLSVPRPVEQRSSGAPPPGTQAG